MRAKCRYARPTSSSPSSSRYHADVSQVVSLFSEKCCGNEGLCGGGGGGGEREKRHGCVRLRLPVYEIKQRGENAPYAILDDLCVVAADFGFLL